MYVAGHSPEPSALPHGHILCALSGNCGFLATAVTLHTQNATPGFEDRRVPAPPLGLVTLYVVVQLTGAA